MKKILFISAAVLAMTFASCDNKTAAPAASADSATAQTLDTASLAPEAKTALSTLTGVVSQALQNKDPKALTTTLANMQATYKALVNAGKLEDAKTYASAIQNFIKEHADAIKTVASGNTTIASLVNGIANLPTTAETTADEAKAAVAADAVSLAAPYLQKAADAKATADAAAAALKNAPATVEAAAKTAADAAVTSAENTAKTAVSNAETAAANKVNSEVSKAQNKANEAVTKAQNKAAKKVNDAQKKANDAVNNAASKALKGIGL